MSDNDSNFGDNILVVLSSSPSHFSQLFGVDRFNCSLRLNICVLVIINFGCIKITFKLKAIVYHSDVYRNIVQIFFKIIMPNILPALYL